MGKGRGAADTMEGFAGDGPRSNHMGQDVPVLYGTNPKMPWWTMGDVDSFFMLLFDNLSSLSGIIAAALNAPVFIEPAQAVHTPPTSSHMLNIVPASTFASA